MTEQCKHIYMGDIVDNEVWFYCKLCKSSADAIELENAINEHAALKRKNRALMELRPSVLARMFHDNYEELAPMFGYKTREETRVFDVNTPNGELMVAVAKRILDTLLDAQKDRLSLWANEVAQLEVKNETTREGILKLISDIDKQMGDSDLLHTEDESIEIKIMQRLSALLTEEKMTEALDKYLQQRDDDYERLGEEENMPSNLMDNWEELKRLISGLAPTDQYNQIIGDVLVAIERGIVRLEAETKTLQYLRNLSRENVIDLLACEKEQLAKYVRELEEENTALRKMLRKHTLEDKK